MQNQLEANKSALKNFLLAFSAGNVAKIKEMVPEDFKLVTMGSSLISGTRNRDEVCALANNFSSAIKSGIELRFLSMTAEEDRVSCEMESYSTLVNGSTYNNVYHLLAYFREGRLATVKEYLDTKYADATLGPLFGA